MKRLLIVAGISLSLVLFHTPSAGAIFGIGDCSKASKSIGALERAVVSNIDYIRGLAFARPSVDGTQGVKLYEKYIKIGTDLGKIRKLGLAKKKCFAPSTQAFLNLNEYWSASYYVYVQSLSGRYYVISGANYLPLRFK
jgi:hypothetical protein